MKKMAKVLFFLACPVLSLTLVTCGSNKGADEILNSTAFTPSSLSGLQLWLSAGSISGVSNGGTVATWTDLSTNGNNVTQATQANRPTLTSSAINGLPAVHFNGSTMDIGCTSCTFSFSGMEAFVIARVNSTSANVGVINFIDAGTIDYVAGNSVQVWDTGFNGGPASGADARWGSSNTGVSNITLTVTQYLLYGFSASGSNAAVSIKLRSNGTQFATGTQNENILHTPTRVLIGARYQTVGSPNAIDSFANIDVAEIIVYGAALSDTNRQQVEQYLNSKYKIY